MRCLAIISSIALALAHASDPSGPMADATQLNALGLVGAFLQERDLPAPWMNHPHVVQHRRLNGMPQVTLPAACSDACPDATTVFQNLQQKMVTAMMKHMDAVQSMQSTLSGDGGSMDPENLSKLMTAMRPMMKDIFAVAFEDMCANKASYMCTVTHADKCMDKAAESMGDSMMPLSDPLALAPQFAPQLNCFCDKCPESKAMVIDMYVDVMSATMTSFSLLGEVGSVGTSTGGSPQDMTKDMTTSLMKAVCPIVGMGSCFEANPNECSLSSMMPGSMVAGMGSMGPTSQNVGGIAQLRAACEEAGVDTNTGDVNKPGTPQLSGSHEIGVTRTVWAMLTLLFFAAM